MIGSPLSLESPAVTHGLLMLFAAAVVAAMGLIFGLTFWIIGREAEQERDAAVARARRAERQLDDAFQDSQESSALSTAGVLAFRRDFTRATTIAFRQPAPKVPS